MEAGYLSPFSSLFDLTDKVMRKIMTNEERSHHHSLNLFDLLSHPLFSSGTDQATPAESSENKGPEEKRTPPPHRRKRVFETYHILINQALWQLW